MKKLSIFALSYLFACMASAENVAINTTISESTSDDIYILDDDVDNQTITSLTVNIADNPTVEGDIYLVYADGEVDGDVTLNLSQGTFTGDINVVGAYVDENNDYAVKSGTVTGDVEINITGGTYYNDINAGVDTNNDYTGNTGEYAEGTIEGSVTVNISGNDIEFKKAYTYSYSYEDAEGNEVSANNYDYNYEDRTENITFQEDFDAIYNSYLEGIANNGDYYDGYFYYYMDGATISGGDQYDGKATLNISAYNTENSKDDYFEVEHFDEINITDASNVSFLLESEDDTVVNITDKSTLNAGFEIDGGITTVKVEEGSDLNIFYIDVHSYDSDTLALEIEGDANASMYFFSLLYNDNEVIDDDYSFLISLRSYNGSTSSVEITGDLIADMTDFSLTVDPSIYSYSEAKLSLIDLYTDDYSTSSAIFSVNDIFLSMNDVDIASFNGIQEGSYISAVELSGEGVSFSANNIEINLTDVTSDFAIYGINSDDGATAKISGNVDVNISGGTYYGDIYAVKTDDDGSNATISGDLNISITGGTYYGDIYAVKTDETSSEGATIKGDLNVTIGGAVSFVQDADTLYIDEDDSSNNKYTVTIAASNNIDDEGNSSDIEGTATLNVLDTYSNADYKTDGTDDEELFDANIVGFDSVNFNVAVGDIEVDEDTDVEYNDDIDGNQDLNGGDSDITINPDSNISTDVAFSFDEDSKEGTTTFEGEMSFSGTGDKIGVEVASDKVVLAGEISATYTTNSDELIAVKTVTGTVEFAANTIVSSIITDSKGNISYGIAITNEEGSGGLSIVLNGTITVFGNIVANSPLSITGDTMNLSGNITTANSSSSSTESEDITISDATLNITDGTITTGNGDLIVDDGSLLATDTEIDLGSGNLDLTDSTFVLAGGSLTANDIINTNSTVTITTGTSGNMGTLNVANITYLALKGSATMLVNETLTLSNTEDYTTAYISEQYISIDNLSYSSSTGTTAKVESLSYFQETQATNKNEMALAVALDSIEATDNEKLNNEIKEIKFYIEEDGLDSYIMNSNSYIAEVNTSLLSNLNVANVNRSREILRKNQGSYITETNSEDTVKYFNKETKTLEDITWNNAKATKSVTPSNSTTVAQLQSINFLGSKDSSNGVAGYDYWSVGATANLDKVFSNNLITGISLGGVYSKVDGDAGDKANSTAFLVNAYTAFIPCDSVEVFANIGYAHFWNEGTKLGVAKADWDSDAFNFLVGTSYSIDTGIKGLSLSPVAMFNLVYLNSDDASYTNAIDVDSESYLSAKLMLGLELQYALSAKFNSTIRLMYAHEFGDDSYDMTYSDKFGFMSGVNYTGGEAGRDSALLGLGLSYDFSESCTGFFDYNAYIYENLITHSLNVSLGLVF